MYFSVPQNTAAWCSPRGVGVITDYSTRDDGRTVNFINSRGIYSFHPGGAHVLFGDGSVHLLDEGVSSEVVAALLTRSGAELIDALQ